jgi:4-aminobutyrate aminotransferase-like enzyme
VLLIADEVMTGWGRTGKWFCVDNWDVKPDILVTAKGHYVSVCAAGALRDYEEDCRLLRGSLLLAWAHL